MGDSDSEKYSIEIIGEKDFQLWDDFVKEHAFGWITHSSAWKDCVEKSFPHVEGHLFALKKNDKIVAGLSIFTVKSWLLGNRLISVPFATICDPLISDAKEAELLLAQAIKLAETQRMENIQIRSLETGAILNKIEIPAAIDDSFKQHYLFLDKSPDELKLSFNKRNVRKRIRQAGEKGLAARIASDKSDVEEFYHIYLKTKKRLGLPPLPLKFLFNLWDKFAANGNLYLILVELENRVLGGILFFKYKDRVNAEIIAYEQMYRDLYLSQFLYWQAILFAREHNCRIFDFGRTSVFNEGLMNYKNHWGTEIRDLPTYYFSLSGKPEAETRESSTMYNLVRAIGRRLPTPLFQLYGNFFYHHSA
ncbi:MAG: GNAT family N-acetyltransferase [Calditrichaeota bacterium]|nr:GNAT family N-acetyltransferase [Calditrichota bacterium]